VPATHDGQMKRISVSLPDDLVERILQSAGGEGQVSSYVASALADYKQREALEELLGSWRAETPVPDGVRRQVEAELDSVGLPAPKARRRRHAG
jgi:predicted transcriptional regulator